MKKFTALLFFSAPVRTTYGTTLNANAQYGEDPEHRKWAAATPAASLIMNVTNEFGDDFEPGQYIVTFEKVEPKDD